MGARRTPKRADDMSTMRGAYLKALGKIAVGPARRVVIPTGIVSSDELKRVLEAVEVARKQSRHR